MILPGMIDTVPWGKLCWVKDRDGRVDSGDGIPQCCDTPLSELSWSPVSMVVWFGLAR
jgi:hypothetical protein